MLSGEDVKKYFSEHPECVESLKGVKYQFKFPENDPNEEIYRPLQIEDIHFISFEGWEGQKGVFAWYYPLGVPHYIQIAEVKEGEPA